MAALEVKQLKKTYPNGFEALKGVDLAVEEGDFYALLGPNGAGKSTLISIICSLLNKTSGHVRVFGYDLQHQKAAAKRMIGLVPQEFNFNIFEPLLEILVNQAGYYGIRRQAAFPRAHQLLDALGLADKKNVYARELSGGMKRRLMIARALMHEPKLLLLDEPTAGVDIEIRHTMWRYLQELNTTGVTIILTTHYLEEAEQLCRNIGIISEGDVVENTSMKSLLSRLQQETFVLELTRPLQTAPTLPSSMQARLLDPQTLSVNVHNKTYLSTLFQHLDEHQIQVISMYCETNRLEQLFMSIIKTQQGPAHVDSD